MSGRGRKYDSTSDSISASDIEGIVEKAVAAATEVIREEFMKLFNELSKRVKGVEDCLNDVTTKLFKYDLESLNQRLGVLEGRGDPGSECEAAVPVVELRRDISEVRAWANDNEQYARRQNIRINGLSVGEGDCRQEVVNFCRTRLQISNIGLQDIDVAHSVKTRSTQPNSSSGTDGDGRAHRANSVLVRFQQRLHRDLVMKQRRLLKGSRTYISEDLTSLNVQTLSRARNSPLVSKTWSWNGRIFALLNSGKKIIVKPFTAIQECEDV